MEGPFHGSPKTDPTFELDRHIFGYQLRIQFRTSYFYDIDLYLRIRTDLRDIIRHTLDLRTFPANHQPGTRRVQRDTNTVPCSLNNHLGESCKLKATTQVLTHSEILMKFFTVVIAFSVPLGAPITIDNESESDGIYFLSHSFFWWGKFLSPFVLLPPRPLQPSVVLR